MKNVKMSSLLIVGVVTAIAVAQTLPPPPDCRWDEDNTNNECVNEDVPCPGGCENGSGFCTGNNLEYMEESLPMLIQTEDSEGDYQLRGETSVTCWQEAPCVTTPFLQHQCDYHGSGEWSCKADTSGVSNCYLCAPGTPLPAETRTRYDTHDCHPAG